MFDFYKPGRLEVIAGPMRSGKTLELISRFSKLDYANIGYIVFQPEIDTRDATVTSRAGLTLPSTKITYPKDAYVFLNDNQKVIGFDEAQFFDDSIEALVEDLLLQDKNVIISGLDMDAQGKKFGSMDYFLRNADYVTKLSAVCDDCGDSARYTKRKNNTGGQIVVGDDMYSVICRKHFHGDKK